MSNSPESITRYSEFWPYYLREHARPGTRVLHILGTTLGSCALIAAIALGAPWLALGALLLGYGPAWIAHFAIEKNRPATFRYPVWSLVSDFRMTALALAGRLTAELRRAGVPSDSRQ